MSSFWYVLGMLIKVLITFFFIFVILPSRFIIFEPEAEGYLDKLFISLITSSFITVLLAHSLSFLKLYEFFSLVFFYLVVYAFVIYLRNRSWTTVLEAFGLSLVVKILDWSEGRINIFNELQLSLFNMLRHWKASIIGMLKWIIREPFSGLCPIIILAYGIFLRFKHSIFHSTYTASDSYGHLAWTKFIGMNEIYHDGVYSYGMHACLSALAKIFFIDPYWIVRFIGPLAGVLLLISVYYFALRLTKNPKAALITATVYGLVTNPIFPSGILRQTALLTQEYSTVFLLPGLYYLWLYLKYGRKRYLFLYAQACCLTVFIHPFATVFLGFWSLPLVVLAIPMLRVKMRILLNYIIYSSSAIILAIIPLGIALLSGKKMFASSAAFITSNITTGSFHPDLSGFMIKLVGGNPFVAAFLIALMFYMLTIFTQIKRENFILQLNIIISTIIILFLYRAPAMNLPTVMEAPRTGVYLAIILAISYACIFDALIIAFSLLRSGIRRHLINYVSGVLAIAICFGLIGYFPPQDLGVEKTMEYEAAANNYLVIKSSFPPLDWTIIAPGEQFEQVVGIGWHFELLRFVQRFSVAEMSDPTFKLPIPTHHIFYYAEKVPLHLGRPITEADAAKSLAKEGPDPFFQFYHTAEQRGILEAKAMQLIEAYRQSHPNVSIFYEDDELKIYYIYHELDPVTSQKAAISLTSQTPVQMR